MHSSILADFFHLVSHPWEMKETFIEDKNGFRTRAPLRASVESGRGMFLSLIEWGGNFVRCNFKKEL